MQAAVDLRVGVSGHRTDQIDAAQAVLVRRRVAEVLRLVQTSAQALVAERGATDGARLRLISALADGADQIAAREALNLGFRLECPLPLARDTYAHTLPAGEARRELADLLSAASAVFELDGATGEDASGAYERVGRVVLRHSDLLIAVWNGERPRGPGGTAQVVEEALRLDMPVVVVPVRLDGAIEILLDGGARRVQLGDGVRPLLEQLVGRHSPRDLATELARFDLPRWPDWLPVYRWFRTALLPPREHANAGDEVVAEEAGEAAAAPARSAEYDWADDIANAFAALYRNSFFTTYVLGALAVAFGLFGYWVPELAIVELVVISAILVIVSRGQRGEWHSRWLEMRFLAEQLRCADLLQPIGRVPSSFREAAGGEAEEDLLHLRTHELFVAIMRSRSLPSVRVDAAYLRRYRRTVRSELVEQLRYQRAVTRDSHALEHRSHEIGLTLFSATLGACAIHVLFSLLDSSGAIELPHGVVTAVDATLTAIAVILPAAGAALAAIATQAEFGRQAARARLMADSLAGLVARLERAHDDVDEMGAIVEAATDKLVEETIGWRTIFRAKPLTLPA